MKLAAAERARIAIMAHRVYTEAESDALAKLVEVTEAESDALAKLVEVLDVSYEDLPAEVASAYNQVLNTFRGQTW